MSRDPSAMDGLAALIRETPIERHDIAAPEPDYDASLTPLKALRVGARWPSALAIVALLALLIFGPVLL